MKLQACEVGCPKRGRKKIVELPQTEVQYDGGQRMRAMLDESTLLRYEFEEKLRSLPIPPDQLKALLHDLDEMWDAKYRDDERDLNEC